MGEALAYASNRYNRVQMNTVSLNNAPVRVHRYKGSKLPSLHCIIFRTATDFACGTGGFLTSALNELDKQVGNSLENREIYNKSVYGIEKKALPHMLCVTNMLIHDIDDPNILHGNALEID